MLHNWLSIISQSLYENDSQKAVSIIKMEGYSDNQKDQIKRGLFNLVKNQNFSILKPIYEPYQEFFYLFFQSQYSSQNPIDNFLSCANAVNLLFDLFVEEKDTNWSLNLVDFVCLKLRFLSYQAEKFHSKSSPEVTSYLVQCQDILKKFFGKMIIDRNPIQISKKMGGLFIIIHLFKIYFKMNNLRLCTNLIKTVQGPSFLPFLAFPLEQRSLNNLGRLMIFEEKYNQARFSLKNAFEECPYHPHNQRLILEYLIPVQLLMGYYPKDSLMEKYQLSIFSPVVESIKKGQLHSFNQSLQTNQAYFIKKEKTRLYVFRNLFHRIHILQKEYVDSKQYNKLKIEMLLSVLRFIQIDMDGDELECIISNLIFQGFIKGYIAHQNSLVVSKTLPFPHLVKVINQLYQND